jgi:hypothetical protein
VPKRPGDALFRRTVGGVEALNAHALPQAAPHGVVGHVGVQEYVEELVEEPVSVLVGPGGGEQAFIEGGASSAVGPRQRLVEELDELVEDLDRGLHQGGEQHCVPTLRVHARQRRGGGTPAEQGQVAPPARGQHRQIQARGASGTQRGELGQLDLPPEWRSSLLVGATPAGSPRERDRSRGDIRVRPAA